MISTRALTGTVAVNPNLAANQAALPTATAAATTPATTTPGTQTPAAAALPDLTPVDAGNVSSPTPGGGSSESYGPSTGASGTASTSGQPNCLSTSLNAWARHSLPDCRRSQLRRSH